MATPAILTFEVWIFAQSECGVFSTCTLYVCNCFPGNSLLNLVIIQSFEFVQTSKFFSFYLEIYKK